MKLLHISDLHIGKRVNEFSMIEDQKYILKKILAIADEQQADGVMIAGDIYDKQVPSAEAVQVFDWFLTELADRGKQVYAVSGNHDSAERIAFGAQLMSSRGVFVSPVYHGETVKLILKDSYGELYLYLLPFIKPAVVRRALEKMSEIEEKSTPESYHDAVKFAVDHMNVDSTKRNILIAHQYVTGAGRCDSEEISVGGLDNVDADIFDVFDYVALGHIHSPQSIKREGVRYCGTPLKYSFSEAEQEKSVTVVTFEEKGTIKISTVPLVPLHDMRKIRGTYLEVTERHFYQKFDPEDYVQITLTDEEDIIDGLQKLRIIYPNLMRLEYDNSRTKQNHVIECAEDIEQKSELELFAEFYELQNNQAMSEEQTAFVSQLIEECK
ncbi:MAG: exonuclease SbcCD subunit D [Lachnospiraceae bacterium]|jgi:exonuclease SbcD|nr:exonuclease SbcCD subunit D [Lachnospiraceae bacterium]